MLARHQNLVLAAAGNVARNALGLAVAASGLLVALTLLLAGIAISEGAKAEALATVAGGPGVYVTWDVFGRDAAIPDEALAELATIGGVERVVPRVVGRLNLGGETATVLGVPLDALRTGDAREMALEGRLPATEGEVLIGAELARALGVGVGSTVALDGRLLRLFQVSGVVGTTASLWSAKAVVCDLEEARLVFGEGEHVSDACLFVRDGYEELVAEAVERVEPRFRVQTRGLVARYFERGLSLRGGAFAALFALALALAAPSFAVLSYLGATPRRREIGLLKAEGWSTADVLEMVALENLLVGLTVALAAFALAQLWVVGLGAPLLARFFLPDLGSFPAMSIPARFTPLPLVAAFAFSTTVTLSGSLWSTWRTASARPAEALR